MLMQMVTLAPIPAGPSDVNPAGQAGMPTLQLFPELAITTMLPTHEFIKPGVMVTPGMTKWFSVRFLNL